MKPSLFEHALYYPTIDFQDANWIKGMSLIYDRIYRIIPDEVSTNDPEEIRPLIETGRVGTPIRPEKYAKKASEEFIKRMIDWDASAFCGDDEDEEQFSRIHKGKTDYEVRQLFKKMGYSSSSDWIDLPVGHASNYMLYLATHVAKTNNLTLVTDEFAPWTATSYMNCNGLLDEYAAPYNKDLHRDNNSFLYSFVLRDFIPENISEIPTDKIIIFREKRRDEIAVLRQAISNFVEKASEIEEPMLISDQIDDLKLEVEKSLKAYQNSADILKVTSWMGFKSLSFPGAAGVAKLFSPELFSSPVLLGAGFLMGIICTIVSTKEQLRKLRLSNPYSAIALMRKDFKNFETFRGSGDFHWKAYNCMEEFIND